MTESFSLGRLAGVRVGVNWSVLVIFTLIVLGLAAGRFPALHPGEAGVAYLLAGLVAGVVFFGSLLAHELAHAVVARRNGVEVDSITLWLFGGVAKLNGEPPNPGADLRIAGVGPLVSVILAAAFAVVAVVLDAAGLPGLVVGVVVWLAVINAVLALFNLVPAAPLDGGRILRSLLWWRSGDRARAAIGAARSGRVFGWLLIAFGVSIALFGGGFGGIWLALIGWFITAAARAEEEHARMGDALDDVRVADVMTPSPVVVPAEASVQSFIDDWVFRHRHSTFPVVGVLGDPVGLITLQRVKPVPAEERTVTRLGDLAVPMDEVVAASPTDPLPDLLPRMAASPVGRALVMDGGRLVGILSPADVMRRLEVAELAGR
jgi:Zn-dependent protease/predicted transcriptional regulator